MAERKYKKGAYKDPLLMPGIFGYDGKYRVDILGVSLLLKP
jgi:hypothetical protein